MSDPTPPAVSEEMREAVARDVAIWTDMVPGRRPCRLDEWLSRPAGPLASEIARLTGERDAAVANAREPIGDTWDEIRRLEGECRVFIRERDEWKAVANRDLKRAEAAEAETARLRAGIQAMIDGNYDHPRRHRPGQCRHGIYFYDECGSCTDEALAALLTSQEKTDV